MGKCSIKLVTPRIELKSRGYLGAIRKTTCCLWFWKLFLSSVRSLIIVYVELWILERRTTSIVLNKPFWKHFFFYKRRNNFEILVIPKSFLNFVLKINNSQTTLTQFVHLELFIFCHALCIYILRISIYILRISYVMILEDLDCQYMKHYFYYY